MNVLLGPLKSFKVLIVVGVLVVLSALSVVYVKDLNRRLFIQYQAEQVRNNQFDVEWGQLLLEQSTWATQARVQAIAQQKLEMIFPSQNEIIMLK